MSSSVKLVGLFLATGLLTQPAAAFAIDPKGSPLPDLPVNAYLPPVVEPLRLEIRLSRRQVALFEGNTLVKSYPIAVGKAGWETPVGKFKVQQMFKDPPWKHPFKGFVIPGGDPENPLGRRWIGFWTDGTNWVGMHGTDNPSSVGRAASHGCIRMYNKDVEELFTKVSLGTPVTVVR